MPPCAHQHLAHEYCTQGDWRGFTTLVPFDAACHFAFKCNWRRLADHSARSGYLRELHPSARIADTVKIEQIKQGYRDLADPGKPVPLGPQLDLAVPHGRGQLAGRGIWGRAA